MSKKGYLTAEEYRAIRQALGMTLEEAAEFHRVQNIRTIIRWEKGDSWVSELACDKITGLLEKINKTISETIEMAREVLKKGELEAVLIIYPDSCYKKFAVGFAELPNSVHKAMIVRTYTALKELGADTGIVEFNPQDYFAYIGSQGMTDNPASRAAWAADYRRRILQ